MARRQKLPRDTSVHYNPYQSTSGTGKFFLAKIGRKLTGGKPLAKRFEKEADACRWILEQVVELETRIRRFGEVASELTAHQYASAVSVYRTLGNCPSSTMSDLAEFWVAGGQPAPAAIRQLSERLCKLGPQPMASMMSALDYFERHCPDPLNQRTVRAVFERWLKNNSGRPILLFETAKQRGKRERAAGIKQRSPMSAYVRGMKASMTRFAERFGDESFHTIDVDQAQDWLNSLPAKTNSQIHYHKDLLTLWNWAVDQMKYAKINPWSGVKPPKADPIKIGILPPLDCFRLLHTAATNPKYIGLLARLICCLMCGMRTQEVKRLQWSHIRLNTRQPVIKVEADVAKTKHRRVIELSKNAIAWFKHVPDELKIGKVSAADWDHLIKDLRRDAGVTEFPRNCMRHSFASYHCSRYEPELTAKVLGHSVAILKEHYVSLVMPEEADVFWAIFPHTTEAKLNEILAAA